MVRETEISLQFGFQIYELIPMKGVYLLKTSKGNKCLKKINYGTQKLMYLHMAKEHIVKNGFDKIDRFNLTLEGTPYAMVNDDIYVVTDWIEGRECDFRNLEELKMAAETLAKFHLCARGFMPDETHKVRDDIGKLPQTLHKRMLTLNKMRDLARKSKRKVDFDFMYLSNVDFFLELAKQAVKVLDLEGYTQLCEESLNERVLCHHDYTYHNIIIDTNNDGNIVDFDYCKSELQIYDVSTLIIKALKRLDWNIEYAREVVQAYNNIKPISPEEKNVLKTLLSFPQRFWRLANRFYYREAGWSENIFIKKMREIIEEKELYVKFIENVDEILK
jgi:CotS family spore coat protein